MGVAQGVLILLANGLHEWYNNVAEIQQIIGRNLGVTNSQEIRSTNAGLFTDDDTDIDGNVINATTPYISLSVAQLRMIQENKRDQIYTKLGVDANATWKSKKHFNNL